MQASSGGDGVYGEPQRLGRPIERRIGQWLWRAPTGVPLQPVLSA
jgi:hypothetical protein